MYDAPDASYSRCRCLPWPRSSTLEMTLLTQPHQLLSPQRPHLLLMVRFSEHLYSIYVATALQQQPAALAAACWFDSM
jgi:hypothetical protein